MRDNNLLDIKQRRSVRVVEHAKQIGAANYVKIDLVQLEKEYKADKCVMRLCKIFGVGRAKIYTELKKLNLFRSK